MQTLYCIELRGNPYTAAGLNYETLERAEAAAERLSRDVMRATVYRNTWNAERRGWDCAEVSAFVRGERV